MKFLISAAFAFSMMVYSLSAQEQQAVKNPVSQEILSAGTASAAVQASTQAQTAEISTAPAAPKEFEFTPQKVNIDGIVLTPTAYRGKGINSVGTALDFNASYYIGRLYGKNTFSWTSTKKNYLDRVGLWLLEADGKMMVQTEGRYRPAMAAGVKGIFKFRDAPQPSLNSPSVSVKVDNKNTDTYAAAYLSISKRIHPKFFLNAGYTDGDMPKIIYQMSEFLSDSALKLDGYANPRQRISQTAFYGGFIWMLRPKNPIELEIIAPQGGPLSPKLINLQMGTLLKLNFQISYLTYKGGWEYLGLFNFRYSYFPR